MGRVSQPIPNLFNGISQQSPSIRLPSQGESQVNGDSSLVKGLGKRPALNHLAKLMATPTDKKIFTHVINRDANEQYLVVIYDDVMKMFDLSDGSEVGTFGPTTYSIGTHTPVGSSSTVLTDSAGAWHTSWWAGYLILNITDGSWGTITANTATTITCSGGLTGGTGNEWDQNDEYEIFNVPSWLEYLEADSHARSDFEMITVADYSFLVNKTVEVDSFDGINYLSKSKTIKDWSKLALTLTAQTTGGPFGEEHLELLIFNTGGSTGHWLGNASANSYFTDNQNYTFSCWLKKHPDSAYDYGVLRFCGKEGTYKNLYVDLTDGSIHGNTSSSIISHGTEKWGNGWYRCWMTINITTGASNPQGFVYACDNVPSYTFTSDGTSKLLMYGPQMEPGSAPKAYTVTDPTDTVKLDTQPYEVYVWVKSGINSCKYQLHVDGTKCGYTTDTVPANYRTDKVAAELQTLVDAISGVQCIQRGSMLMIYKDDGTNFPISCSDSWGDQALVVMKGEVDREENLPPNCWHGTKLKVKGQVSEDDDYYVEFNINGGEVEKASGAHDGAVGAAKLTDSGESWSADGLIGMKVKNVTDGSHAFITDNNGTTATGKLRQGLEDDWDTGDLYEIVSCFGPGVWTECRGWQENNELFNKTMPHKLVRQSDGYFYFSPIDWGSRSVGDEDSSSLPSFVDQTISDVFFFRNRLGFTSDENIVMSRAGDFFEFFRSTTLEVLDDDPIDGAVSHNKISLLDHAVPWNKELLFFSKQTQFTTNIEDTLTPSSFKVDSTTEFENTGIVRPVGAGPYVYFPVPTGDFTSIREYYVDKQNLANDAANVTAHCPRYIPKDVFQLISSTSEDCLFALSEQEATKIYIYKYYWAGEEKIQSSWSQWTVSSEAEVLSLGLIQSTLYLIVKRTDGVYLEYMDLQSGQVDGTLPFSVLLDRKVELTGVYSSGDGWTTWTLPYEDASTDFVIVKGPDFTGEHGSSIAGLTRPSNTTLRVTGDESDGECWVGRPYSHTYQLSTQYVRQDNKSITEGRLQLQRITFNFTDSGLFYVEVKPYGGSLSYDYEYSHNAKWGAKTLITGEVYYTSGSFTLPLMGRNIDAIITIKNDSYFPSNIHSAEWEGNFVMLTKRL